MFKRYVISLFAIIIAVFISSCNQKPDISSHGNTFKEIILTGEGNFRGISIGENIEKVKGKEKAKLVTEEKDYLYYNLPLDSSNFFDLSYYFDYSGLYEIMFDATFDKKTKADELFKSFYDYYTAQYGTPQIQEKFHIWKTSSSISKHIEIALVNKSEIPENGYISLIISNYDY